MICQGAFLCGFFGNLGKDIINVILAKVDKFIQGLASIIKKFEKKITKITSQGFQVAHTCIRSRYIASKVSC